LPAYVENIGGNQDERTHTLISLYGDVCIPDVVQIVACNVTIANDNDGLLEMLGHEWMEQDVGSTALTAITFNSAKCSASILCPRVAVPRPESPTVLSSACCATFH